MKLARADGCSVREAWCLHIHSLLAPRCLLQIAPLPPTRFPRIAETDRHHERVTRETHAPQRTQHNARALRRRGTTRGRYDVTTTRDADDSSARLRTRRPSPHAPSNLSRLICEFGQSAKWLASEQQPPLTGPRGLANHPRKTRRAHHAQFTETILDSNSAWSIVCAIRRTRSG